MSRRAAAILLAVLAAAVAALILANRGDLASLSRRVPRPFLRVTPAPAPIVTPAPGVTAPPAVETVRITLYFPDQNGMLLHAEERDVPKPGRRRRVPSDDLRRAPEGADAGGTDRRHPAEDAAPQRLSPARGRSRARPRGRLGPDVRLRRGADDRRRARRHDAPERGRDVPCENPRQWRARRDPGRPRGPDPAASLPEEHRRRAGIGEHGHARRPRRRREPGDAAPRRPRAGRASPRHDRDGRRPPRRGLRAHHARRHARPLRGLGRGPRAAVSEGKRQRLGHGRVRHAPARDAHALGAGGGPGKTGRAGRSRSSASSGARSGASRSCAASASARSRSTATSCRPTAGPAAPGSRARASRSRWRSRSSAASRRSRAGRCARRSRRSRSGSARARRSSTSPTPRTPRPTSTATSSATASGAFVEIQGTAERRPFTRGPAPRAPRAGEEGTRDAARDPGRGARAASAGDRDALSRRQQSAGCAWAAAASDGVSGQLARGRRGCRPRPRFRERARRIGARGADAGRSVASRVVLAQEVAAEVVLEIPEHAVHVVRVVLSVVVLDHERRALHAVVVTLARAGAAGPREADRLDSGLRDLLGLRARDVLGAGCPCRAPTSSMSTLRCASDICAASSPAGSGTDFPARAEENVRRRRLRDDRRGALPRVEAREEPSRDVLLGRPGRGGPRAGPRRPARDWRRRRPASPRPRGPRPDEKWSET